MKKKIVSLQKTNEGKEILIEIVSMLIGLIKSSSDRIYEEKYNYGENVLGQD